MCGEPIGGATAGATTSATMSAAALTAAGTQLSVHRKTTFTATVAVVADADPGGIAGEWPVHRHHSTERWRRHRRVSDYDDRHQLTSLGRDFHAFPSHCQSVEKRRQGDCEDCTLPSPRVRQLTLVLSDDAVGHEKAKACAAFLRCEVWFEKMVTVLVRYSGPVV